MAMQIDRKVIEGKYFHASEEFEGLPHAQGRILEEIYPGVFTVRVRTKGIVQIPVYANGVDGAMWRQHIPPTVNTLDIVSVRVDDLVGLYASTEYTIYLVPISRMATWEFYDAGWGSGDSASGEPPLLHFDPAIFTDDPDAAFFDDAAKEVKKLGSYVGELRNAPSA